MLESSLGKRFYPGFDYLRVVLSVAVVAWHVRLFGKSDIFDELRFLDHHFAVSDFVNFHILLLAVPAFMLMALFLFVEKVQARGRGYFVERVKRLVFLYLLWSSIAIVWWRDIEIARTLAWDWKYVMSVVATGGFSIFYFFFSLILVTLASYIAIKFPRYLLYVLLIASSFLLWVMPLVVAETHSYPYLVAYWNPLNFIPYAFVAVLASSYVRSPGFEKRLANLIVFLSLAFVLSSVIEWHLLVHADNFPGNGFAMPAYTRISVVVGASLLFFLSFYLHRPPNVLVRFLSDCSLGLYCVHPFILDLGNRFIDNLWMRFGVVLVVSYAGVYLVKHGSHAKSAALDSLKARAR